MANGTSKAKVSASTSVRLRRQLRFVRSRARELMKIGKALVSTKHPFLVHIIPMRRCNLDCGYCNEYDEVSKPVPLAEMKRRLDLLADMGTSMITISGGEPLLHPELEEVIRHMRKRGMYTGMITNGFLLSKDRIEKLNDAGLEYLQISIDNVTPDEVSKKSLKTLDSRLEWLSQYAVFQVNINSVLGSGVKNPEDALQIAHRAVELGFTSTVGIIHDGNGQLKSLNPRQIEIFEEIMSLGKSFVFPIQRFSAQRGARERTRLALPVGFAVFVRMRRRAGALVLATAWVSGNSTGGIHDGNAAPGVLYGEVLRAEMYGLLCAASGDAGQLAWQTDAETDAHGAASCGVSASPDWFRPQRIVKSVRLPATDRRTNGNARPYPFND